MRGGHLEAGVEAEAARRRELVRGVADKEHPVRPLRAPRAGGGEGGGDGGVHRPRAGPAHLPPDLPPPPPAPVGGHLRVG